METTLLMMNNKSEFTTNFSDSICTDGTAKYEAALLSVDFYYSIPNIKRGDNNVFVYSSDSGVSWKTIELDTGSYELGAINEEINRNMKINGDYNKQNDEPYINISPNLSKLSAIISIDSDAYKVRFGGENSIGSVLGFPESITIGIGYTESPAIVQITKLNSILIHTDFIMGGFVNGSPSAVIYSFEPNIPPGYKINQTPNPIIYYPVTRNNINRIRFWLTDQNDNLIDTRGETITIKIHVREKKK